MEHNTLECDACIANETRLRELARNGSLSNHEFDKLFSLAMKIWYRDCPGQTKRDNRIGNNKPKGLFAGTLTMRPGESTEEEMISAINKIFSQKTCPLLKYAWYLEYTKNDTPHIHFCYETESGGRIHQKVFKRYWDWDESVKCGAGHRGGYHKACDSETAYLEYISKDSGQNNVYGFSI